MTDLIDRAVEIWMNGGEMDDVWVALNGQYAQFGDPVEVHMEVLDGADAKLREIYG